MRIVFLHQNFPGQFLSVARALKAEGGHQLVAITDEANKRPDLLPTVRYKHEAPNLASVPTVARPFVTSAARGAVVTEALRGLKSKGFTPDIVIGHLGWGETLFVRDVFPETRVLVHAEFYYAPAGADVGFDPEFQVRERQIDTRIVRARNANILLSLAEADRAVAPTRWQASRFPAEVRGKIVELHEGIRTDTMKPDAGARLKLADGPEIAVGDEVVTFVNRNLEPYRGYHVLMRALPQILAQRPKARVVIVGADGVSYGSSPPAGKTWKQIFLDEVRERLPMERVHFVGQIPYAQFTALMQISAAHVYLTYPFVLSWSMLEAMSAGAIVIGSATPPVTEVIRHGENGLLFDFFDVDGLARQVVEVLAAPERFAGLKVAARQTIVEHYDLATRCLPAWLELVRRTAEGR